MRDVAVVSISCASVECIAQPIADEHKCQHHQHNGQPRQKSKVPLVQNDVSIVLPDH